MATLRLNTTYTRTFFMVLSSDHISPATGLTVVVTLCKAGAAFGAAAGAVTEVANGWYKVALTTVDTGTLGDLAFHCTSATADNTDFVDQVVLYTTDALPKAVWDEVLTAALHNVTNSAGKLLRLINPNSDVIFSGAVASATASTVVLPAGASSANGAYITDVFSITAGTGQGSMVCTSYVGSTRTATFANQTWSVTPIAADTVEITPSAAAKVIGYATGQDPYTLVMLAAMTEGYAAKGAAPTMEQAAFMIWSSVSEFSIVGTTITTRKIDDATAAMTFTLDSSSNPTSRTRAT